MKVEKKTKKQLFTLKHHLDTLISVTKTISSQSHLDELLEKIVHYALTVTGAERGFLFLYSNNNEGLTLEIEMGVREDLRNEVFSFATFRVSREIIKFVENTGRALIGGQENSSIAKGFSDLKRYGVNQVLCVPFQSRGKLMGFLYLDHSFVERELFREQELELIETFATLTSLSIENAYLTRMLDGQEHKHISITIEQNPSVPNLSTITIEGILDFDTMRQFDKKCVSLIEHKPPDVIMDLSNIDYASRSGIFCLVKYMVLITTNKRTIRFVKPPPHVFKNMEIVGLSKKFDMYDTIGEAISTFQ